MDDGPPEKPVRRSSASISDHRDDEKQQAIKEACRLEDVTALVDLAKSPGGFLNDELRKLVWPLLLGHGGLGAFAKENDSSNSQRDWRKMPRHKDEDQVELDVSRSFVFYPSNEPDSAMDCKKDELSSIIIETLRRYPFLAYFQGYHDIVQVFLLVLGKDLAVGAVARLSLLRIRDFMLPSLSPSLAHLHLIPAVLSSVDLKLYRHLSRTRPFFALAATLTLYAHEIQEYGDIARLFDFLLSQEAVVSVYFFVQIVLSRKEELFEIPAEDSDMLHFTLSKLPQPLDLDSLIAGTTQLFLENPPGTLPFGAWRKVSSYSVLKTTARHDRALGAAMPSDSLGQGEAYFRKQLGQLQWAERRQQAQKMLWCHRRSVGAAGLTIMIGVFSIWLQRHNESGLPGLLHGLSIRFGRLKISRWIS